ncbi:hypothetical protein DNTS_009456 [Danionella cerebrum]|uniref:Uncharacterized protein n=1 Tax=Danionella cerebrum TaxID=2873325 RepID=A0A553PWT3_9TELE|nr:hypothetical protein DNTS_009456 [Danionella translucida]
MEFVRSALETALAGAEAHLYVVLTGRDPANTCQF